MWLFGKKKKEKISETKQVEKVEQSPAEKKSTPAKTSAKPVANKNTKAPSKTASKSSNAKKQISKTATKKSIYRVVYDKDARVWVNKKDGAKRNIASFPTKDEALARVKELSESQDLNFVVHKKDGKFQKKA